MHAPLQSRLSYDQSPANMQLEYIRVNGEGRQSTMFLRQPLGSVPMMTWMTSAFIVIVSRQLGMPHCWRSWQ